MRLHALTSQQWSTLSILANNVPTLDILSEDTWSSNANRGYKEKSHDSKGFDPLHGDDDGEELGDTESYVCALVYC